MPVEEDVARHYTSGNLLERIRQGLATMGRDPDHPSLDDLKPVDEFHIGGVEATGDLLAQIDLGPRSALLDIGSGLGGPARFIASNTGCHVTGIDLTEEFVATAGALSEMTGLAGRTSFIVGSALDLPFAPASFDAATLIHVGMNLPDKPVLFAGVARVLRPGRVFAVYDVMRTGPGELAYPVPWAETAATDFSAPPDAYRVAAAAAGFTIAAERVRRDFALDFFRARAAGAAGQDGPPPLGIHLLTGTTGPEKMRNMITNIEAGVIAPVEMICSLGD
ncbi:MAG TPA: class I SAM-dependent methyltransferase [Thermohalobaculum sp.]|nr:class I SAM-dependent methyltransferase [Thermohalobaculum sp.]